MFNNRVNNILKNVIFKRILVIFIVGLVSRSLINFMLHVNILTYIDCGNDKLFIYWGLIMGFLTIVYELPGINFNVFNFKLIRNGISLYMEDILKSGDKLTCGGESFNKDLKTSSPGDQSVYTQNNSRGHSRKTSGSSSGGRVYPAGVVGLYGENSRTRRVSAGIKGLYGDDSTRTSSSSNKESVSNRDKKIKRTGNIIVKQDDSNMTNERVSGFNRINRVVSGVFKGLQENSYYVPRELHISLRDKCEYLSSNNVSEERITPKAPRPTNYSTPETMSPLFTSSNKSERFYGRSNEVVERGWGSLFSNSPRVISSENGSYDSDLERKNIYHRNCRDISEGISKDFSRKRC
jgi:hypothetical protein